MRSDVVAIVAPKSQFATRVAQRVEGFFIHQLVTQASIEAFNKTILLRLTWINVMPIHIVITCPFQDGTASELRSVV